MTKVDTGWVLHDTRSMLYHHDVIRPNRSAQQLRRRELLHDVLGILGLLAALSPWFLLLKL